MSPPSSTRPWRASLPSAPRRPPSVRREARPPNLRAISRRPPSARREARPPNLRAPGGGGPPARSPHASAARSGRSRSPARPCRRPRAPQPPSPPLASRRAPQPPSPPSAMGGVCTIRSPLSACRRRVAPLMLQFPRVLSGHDGASRPNSRPCRRPRAPQPPSPPLASRRAPQPPSPPSAMGGFAPLEARYRRVDGVSHL